MPQAEDEIDDIVQEIAVMAQCDSAYVTRYYGAAAASGAPTRPPQPPCVWIRQARRGRCILRRLSVALAWSGSHVSGTKLWIVMEYVGGGSILDMMDAGHMSEEHIKTVVYDVR